MSRLRNALGLHQNMNRRRLIVGGLAGLVMLTLAIGGGMYLGAQQQVGGAFPDAVILLNKPVFKGGEDVVMTVRTGRPAVRQVSRIISSVSADSKAAISVEVVASDGQQVRDLPISVNWLQGDEYLIRISPSATKTIRPGKQTLKVVLDNGQASRTITQDFAWGVLAVNANKSIYQPHEKAKLFFSVLDDQGFNDCQAKLELSISGPAGQSVLSSDEGTIKKNPECPGHNATYDPDYYAEFVVGEAGDYKLLLRGESKNGVYEVADVITVKDAAPLEIERTSATRINPVAAYTMELTVTAQQDIKGQLVEQVPFAFKIVQENGLEVERDDGDRTQRLVWSLQLSKGQSKTFAYTFDAPDLSPEFYLMGPAVVRSQEMNDLFSENRWWQIAADPTRLLMLWDDPGNIPAGWSCVSCAGGDTFYNKFIRGAASYSAVGGGSDTHTPTVASNVVSEGTSTGSGGHIFGSSGISVSHTHANANPTIGSASNVPVYRSLAVIQYDEGIPYSLPAGSIAFFDDSVPEEWTRYSAQDDYYVRGAGSVATGGSNTHSHTVAWSSLSAASGSAGGYDDKSGANNSHTHNAPSGSSTPSMDAQPPYITSILAKSEAETDVPIGMIGMFDGAVDENWDMRSDSGDVFYERFPKGGASFGSTGGSATHNHSSITSGPSGPPIGTGQVTWSYGTGYASSTHTHTITTTFDSGSNNIPAYTDVIMAELIIELNPNPTDIVFTNSARSFPAEACSGLANVFSLELQKAGSPSAPTESTVVRVSSTSADYTIYADSNCTSTVVNGDITFGTSDSSKDVYIVDNSPSSPTWTLSASQQSGVDLAGDSQEYIVTAPHRPTKIAFTNPVRSVPQSVCSGSAKGLVIELQNADDQPFAPTQSTVVKLTSNSSGYTLYSDDSCSTPIVGGNITFNTSQTSKIIYIADDEISEPSWLLEAVRQSGDILDAASQSYIVLPPPSIKIEGVKLEGVRID